jgi:hypothetical protein
VVRSAPQRSNLGGGAGTGTQQAETRATRSAQLGHWLANPLLVTVVAALLGSWLLPQLTRGWQDHQKSLEIQTGLVSQMSESVSSAVATGRFIAAGLVAESSTDPRAEQRAWNDGYRTWTTESASIGAKLRAYVGSGVGSEWQTFTYVVTDFLQLSANVKRDSGRVEQVREIFTYRDRLKNVHLSRQDWLVLATTRSGAAFQSAYAELGRGLLARQDELVQRVLDSSVSGF